MSGILVLEEYELKILDKALKIFINSYGKDELDYEDAKRLRNDVLKILKNNVQSHKGGQEL